MSHHWHENVGIAWCPCDEDQEAPGVPRPAAPETCGEWFHPAPTQRCSLPAGHFGLHEPPAAPDTTGGDLREAIARGVFRKVMDREGKRKLQWEHLEPWTQDGWLGWADDLLDGPLRDLLAERDKLAAQVRTCERLEALWRESGHGYAADHLRRALGTPTTGGGE